MRISIQEYQKILQSDIIKRVGSVQASSSAVITFSKSYRGLLLISSATSANVAVVFIGASSSTVTVSVLYKGSNVTLTPNGLNLTIAVSSGTGSVPIYVIPLGDDMTATVS